MDNENGSRANRATIVVMPRIPHRPAELTNRVFRGTGPLASNAVSAEQLRTAAWLHVHRGTYSDADIPLTHGLRCDAALLVIPNTAAIGGRSAAWLHGIELVKTWDPVEVIVPPDARFGPVRGLRIRRTELPKDDVIRAPGRVAVTTPERTAWDIARFHKLEESVPLLDVMVAARLVTVKSLQARLSGNTVRWGRRRIATALDLIDRRAESPQESRVRVRLVLAGLPRPVSQHDVFDGSRFIARVDLAWPAQRVAVEYDGIWHADAAQLHRDRRRLNSLIAAGWAVIHVTAVRMHDFDTVVAEIRAALARA